MKAWNIFEELADSHCHLDSRCDKIGADTVSKKLENWRCRSEFFHLMSTNHIDLHLIDRLARESSRRSILPYFGVHPWYSHLFSVIYREEGETEEEFKRRHYDDILEPQPSEDLLRAMPHPISLAEHLEAIREMVRRHERGGIGEIGLDKLFRVPNNGYFGNREVVHEGTNKLSPCRVRMSHQRIVLEKQLEIASEFGKQVSLHCVKSHGALFEVVSKFSSIHSVILHSYSGSIDQFRVWNRHCKKTDQRLFLSLSNWINGAEKKSDSFKELVSALADDQILIETDFGIDRFFAGEDKTDEYTQHIYAVFQKIRTIKNWDEETARRNIAANIHASTTRKLAE